MRLIDGKEIADEILGKIFERGQASGIWEDQLEIGAITYRDIEFANGYDAALDDIYKRISNAPTVEAIPIEWLLDYFAYIEDEVFHNNLKITKDNIEQIFDELIATWERENEAN